MRRPCTWRCTIGQDLSHDRRLLYAAHDEHDFPGGIEHGKRHRDPMSVQGADPVLHAPPPPFGERWRSGKERRGVAIGAQAKQYQIEPGRRVATAEGHPNLVFVLLSGTRGIGNLGVHAIDVLRVNGDPREQCLGRHPVVALRMILRHMPLVTPEELDLVPAHLRTIWLIRQHAVDAPGRRAA